MEIVRGHYNEFKALKLLFSPCIPIHPQLVNENSLIMVTCDCLMGHDSLVETVG